MPPVSQPFEGFVVRTSLLLFPPLLRFSFLESGQCHSSIFHLTTVCHSHLPSSSLFSYPFTFIVVAFCKGLTGTFDSRL